MKNFSLLMALLMTFGLAACDYPEADTTAEDTLPAATEETPEEITESDDLLELNLDNALAELDLVE